MKFFSKAQTRMDICAVTIAPNQPEPVEGMMEAYFSVQKRGGKLRLLTELTKDNAAYCKEVMSQGVEIRHLQGIKGNFAISDSEYLASLETEEFDPRGPVLFSNDMTFVKHHQAIFDMLWKSAISGDQRIAEIELGIMPAIVEVLYDPMKIWNRLLDMIREARKEVLLLLPSVNAFRRQEQSKLIDSLSAAAVKGEIRVKVLTAMDSLAEKRIASEQRISPIQYQRLTPESGQETIKTIVVDRERSLVIEIKDDSAKDFVSAAGPAVYSTSRATVLSNVSFFERLWNDNQMIEEVARRRNQLPENQLISPLAWEITPAKFRCIRCGKNVKMEIRIYEPRAMQAESAAVTNAMNERDAGWIPFCFDCISSHPLLRPPWLATTVH